MPTHHGEEDEPVEEPEQGPLIVRPLVRPVDLGGRLVRPLMAGDVQTAINQAQDGGMVSLSVVTAPPISFAISITSYVHYGPG